MSDDSEYEAYNDFADLTEEDFARLDAASALSSPPVTGIPGSSQAPDHAVDHVSAMPSVSIEVEGSHASAEEGSPIHRYRRRGTLTVTDLISLAWCEVQFDYGMRQKRFRRLADRPPSFRAESGKEILVQQDVAARNDKTTKRGQFIHKELELELRPEEIEIVITSAEEHWAFRLINSLSSLASLGAEGRAVRVRRIVATESLNLYIQREIPVFGIVDGVVVIGIIDELLVRDQPGPETGTKRASDSSLPSPKRSCQSPSPPPYEAEIFPASLAPTPPPQCIRLIDTKTRRTDSLPSDEDSAPAQLQVMLYHRLLIGLLETSAQFDYPALWALVRVDPSAPFSRTFLQQATQIVGVESIPKCLDDVVVLLRTRIAELNLPAVDDTLQIIYRSQNKYPDRRRRNKGKDQETTYIPTIHEADEIAKAIEMSLEDVFEVQLAAALKESALVNALPVVSVSETRPGGFNPDQGSVCGTSTGPELPPIADGSTLGSKPGEGSNVLEREPTLADLSDCRFPVQPREKAETPEILGTKEFPMDDWVLDAYLRNSLEWWRGKRPARGVSDRQTGRCFSCEYRDGCEWREQKAAEKLTQAKLRRRGLKGAAS